MPEIGLGPIVKPFQKPHPPIVCTVVAPFSEGVIEMGKRGFLPISANFYSTNGSRHTGITTAKVAKKVAVRQALKIGV